MNLWGVIVFVFRTFSFLGPEDDFCAEAKTRLKNFGAVFRLQESSDLAEILRNCSLGFVYFVKNSIFGAWGRFLLPKRGENFKVACRLKKWMYLAEMFKTWLRRIYL